MNNLCLNEKRHRNSTKIQPLLRIFFPAFAKSKRKGGRNMAQDVLCEVNNCHYWADGNLCSADRIYVVSHSGEQASTEHETDCKTFVKKDQH